MSHDDEELRDAPSEQAGASPGAHADDADGYQSDPNAPPTVEGRVLQATAELHRLLRASASVTVFVALAIALIEFRWGRASFPTTCGYLAGASVATLNLWVLAGGFFAIMRGEHASSRALLAFGGSFIALVTLAFFVVIARREWTLGFALGLTTPALAGMVYGRGMRDAEAEPASAAPSPSAHTSATSPGGTRDDDGDNGE